jgi:hypothetical protein
MRVVAIVEARSGQPRMLVAWLLVKAACQVLALVALRAFRLIQVRAFAGGVLP